MSKTFNSENLSEKNKKHILHINDKVNESFFLIILSMILLLAIYLIDVFLNMRTFPLLILSFIIILMAITFHIYKLQKAQKLIGIILTAHHYKIDIEQLYKLDKSKLDKLVFIKLNWKNYKGYYMLSILSVLIATLIIISRITHIF
ncbi:MAG: hypothetical protein E7J02_12090 [Staphylococcus warneri]|nr:hypothetical protein [Streptococcus mitis]MDU4493356.1 hypothetical protein [Staphylococcus warneri]MDU4503719.1 hypothetical protein [Staphylococcus warneri]